MQVRGPCMGLSLHSPLQAILKGQPTSCMLARVYLLKHQACRQNAVLADVDVCFSIMAPTLLHRSSLSVARPSSLPELVCASADEEDLDFEGFLRLLGSESQGELDQYDARLPRPSSYHALPSLASLANGSAGPSK